MTKVLHSFAEAAFVFAERVATLYVEAEIGLNKVAEHIEHVAKEEFGEYQPAVGPFPAWAPLAPTTLAGWGPFPGKEQLGYAPPDNPLVREGDLRDSISHEVHALEAFIGSPDERMPWFEFGTSRMPPRPVLGPAAESSKAVIEKLIGAALVVGLIGRTEAGTLGLLAANFET